MLELIEIEKKYLKFHLQNINIKIDAGEIFGLVGPNGAGKSTIVKIISGVLESSKGQVKIFGKIFKVDSIALKKRMGIMGEQLSLFDYLSIQEHLEFIGGVYGLDRETCLSRISEFLTILDLINHRHKLINELSTGMRKKTALISAFIHKPDIIILDEPFENIDPVSSQIIREIIVAYAKTGSVVFITSHNLRIVEMLCSEVGIIDKGRIILQDKTDSIRSRVDLEEGSKYSYLEKVFNDSISTSNPFSGLSWLK